MYQNYDPQCENLFLYTCTQKELVKRKGQSGADGFSQVPVHEQTNDVVGSSVNMFVILLTRRPGTSLTGTNILPDSNPPKNE